MHEYGRKLRFAFFFVRFAANENKNRLKSKRYE